MSELTRYTIVVITSDKSVNLRWGEAREHSRGEYVTYADHVARLQAVEQERDRLRDEIWEAAVYLDDMGACPNLARDLRKAIESAPTPEVSDAH